MHVRVRIAWFLAVLVALSGSLMAQEQAAGQKIPALAPPYKTVTFSHPRPKGATIPFFSHGYLIQFQRGTREAGVPTIYLYNSDGDLEQQFPVWPDGTASFFLASVDVGAGKQLAYAGRQIKTDGSIVDFIALSGLDGANPKYLSTGNYLATRVALADDGSIWAIGEDFPSVTSPEERWENFDTLRHYSASGALLDQFLPRWGSNVAYVTATPDAHGHYAKLNAYGAGGNLVTAYGYPNWGPTAGFTMAWKRTRQIFLRSSGSNTVLYDGMHDLLYEYNGTTLHSAAVMKPYPVALSVTGFALSSKGDVLATMKTVGPRQFGLGGLFLLTAVDGSAATAYRWTEVPGTTGNAVGSFAFILGIDRQAIVYTTKQTSWFPVQVFWSQR